MSEHDRKVRLSQIIAPFGVGGIYDYRGESLIACDTTTWKGLEDVDAKRLSQALRVSALKRPTASASLFAKAFPSLGYARFPQWLFCATCRRLSHHDRFGGGPAVCTQCRGRPQLVPMRFVIACEDGHAGDIDWSRWAHRENPGCKVKDRLRFVTSRSGGTGLESLRVECSVCGSGNSLEGITADSSMQSVGIRCPGKQPWQSTASAEPCDKPVKVLQRGATNLYFAETVSALEIPEPDATDPREDLERRIRGTDGFDILLTSRGAFADELAGRIAELVGCSPEEVLRVAFPEEHTPERTGAPGPDEDIRDPEWRAFLAGESRGSRDFVIRTEPLLRSAAGSHAAFDSLAGLVSHVVLAVRLREVRALKGFRRLSPNQRLVTPSLSDNPLWLPAVEVFGEGVFIALEEARVRDWEGRPEVRRRAARLARKLEGSLMEGRVPAGMSPRFLMLHTFAHLLIRRLAFECGYAAASLRERIYCRTPDQGDPQAGVLIYTAAGDVEGTLGGLVRQGESPRLVRTMIAALDSARWCSSDPICAESGGQGFDGLNLAACHACGLVAETSCDHGNIGLDRAMVVGSDVTGFAGYFSEPLHLAMQATAEAAD